MKLSACFSQSLLFAGTVSAASSATRDLHMQPTDLSNGAELAVNIALPKDGASFVLKSDAYNATLDLTVTGEAHIGKGVPDVGYIYVIDSSSSTSSQDGACGSTLDCVQAFFVELHKEIIADGSAELVAVVDFDSSPTVTAEWQDPGSPEVIPAISLGNSGGGTNCIEALEKAAFLALERQDTLGTTVVVFAGDGECSLTEYGTHSQNVTEAANLLANTGAIVHSIAVGDNIDCKEGNSLIDIPRNGGKCHSFSDPNAPPHVIIDGIVGTDLTKIEMKIDGENYRSLKNIGELDRTLPQEGAISVGFDTYIHNLTEGEHHICVRASGTDSLKDSAEVEDCHTITIKLPEVNEKTKPDLAESIGVPDYDGTLKGWQIFLVVALVICSVGALTLLVHRNLKRRARRAAEEFEEQTQEQDSNGNGGTYVAPI